MKYQTRVVAVSGGLHRPSKSAALAKHLMDLVSDHLPCTQHLIELGQWAPQLAGACRRADLSPSAEREMALVEQADILIVATPVFRGSYTGLFKHFFDFIGQDALIDKPVLLAATGGTERHTLMIEHQMRPLFSFFQARTLPLGVYATDEDFQDYELCDDASIERARLAVTRAMPLIRLSTSLATHQADVMAVA